MAEFSEKPRAGRLVLECSGACGDLGTFIPHVIGAMTVAGLAPAGVLFGFAAFLIGTGLFYGLPLPVQPMKVISAVILTGGLRPGEVAAAGLMIGVVLLVLGFTGWIARLARAIPQSVSAGLQVERKHRVSKDVRVFMSTTVTDNHLPHFITGSPSSGQSTSLETTALGLIGPPGYTAFISEV